MTTIENIIHQKASIYIVSTGAGAGIQNDLWKTPGISSVLVGCEFPYAPETTNDFLGFAPEKHCSLETAVDLSMAAYYRSFSTKDKKTIGIGLTASVTSNREHRGEHRVFVSSFSDDGCKVYSAILNKDSTRSKDGELCDKLGLAALLRNFDEFDVLGSFPVDTFLSFSEINADELALERFLKRPFFSSTGKREESLPENINAIFPGAFNPPHFGHFGIVGSLGFPVAFSIEQKSPHKGDLSLVEMIQRAKMLKGHDLIFTSGCPLYIDKAEKFKRKDNVLNIVMGADAFSRMFDTCWCEDPEELAKQFHKCKVIFYVANRKNKDGKIESVIANESKGEIQIPRESPYISAFPIEVDFDISSSKIREENDVKN